MQVLGFALRGREWHLMGTPEALEEMSVHLTRSCPALRRAEHDHRPAWASQVVMFPGSMTMFTNFIDAALHGRRHCLMHAVDIGSFHKIRSPAATTNEVLEFVVRDSRQQSWVIDLVFVEVENGEYGAIACGVQELIDVL